MKTKTCILSILISVLSSTIVYAQDYTRSPLPYAPNALEPVISEQTISYHYGKHLQAYYNNLNRLIIGSGLEGKPLDVIVTESTGPLYDNAAQAWNHELYFQTFSPKAAQKPTGALADAIDQQWGNLENFKKEFVNKGTSIFGSGWVWLAENPDGTLEIITASNAGNPLTQGKKPLLGADVWEHAYYLDYQNRRADHLADLWKITDWDIISNRYNSTK